MLIYYAAAVFFNLCLTAQVLTVGLAYFYNPTWWNLHVWLVRGYGGLSLLLLGGAWYLPVPQRINSLTTGLPVLIGLQFLTIHIQMPLSVSIPLAVLHPLIGFSLFSASTTLVHRMRHVVWPQTAT
ncbi:hypothetical protein H6F59_06145 [Nodosilinea sp. FACHB-141]|nr:hypothetical protein [Nodosilinea sp. FACHB-141]